MSIRDHIRKRNIIEVDLAQILDRDIPEHDDWWQTLCTHHAFRMSNGIKLELGTYWELPDEHGGWNDIDYDIAFPKFIIELLELEGLDPEEFDGIVLNIDW